MKRAEIKAKFDEIVDFAEVEKFLDTPVKRYSSGMYVRLAIAVTGPLVREILPGIIPKISRAKIQAQTSRGKI